MQNWGLQKDGVMASAIPVRKRRRGTQRADALLIFIGKLALQTAGAAYRTIYGLVRRLRMG
eukprot:14627035-Heterocapsa_arctica.AAC.1